jgi:hypothetical protein
MPFKFSRLEVLDYLETVWLESPEVDVQGNVLC